MFEPLFGELDAIISDSLNHASIIDGIRLSKAKRYRFANNDMMDLEAKLQDAKANNARRIIIVTDGVFSMDGSFADLKNIRRLADQYDALIMVDDCHATGFIGPQGRGTPATDALTGTTAIQSFGNFQRFLAPPKPSTNTPGGAESIARGRSQFESTGCALCHTPTLRTGNSTVVALKYRDANLFSDLLVHDMGPGLADGVTQGQAGPREFRSAPLWGLGQRIFFLHDGRTSDLLEAISEHRSGSTRLGDASEANEVIWIFNNLRESQKQDMLNFLRSL